MLDHDVARQLIEAHWDRLGCRVRLPVDPAEFLGCEGLMQPIYSEKRRFPRYHYRTRAVMVHQGRLHTIYTKNISRSSLLIIHAEQLFPREEVEAYLPNGRCCYLRIRRVRKIGPACFECGAEIRGSEDRLASEENLKIAGTAGAV